LTSQDCRLRSKGHLYIHSLIYEDFPEDTIYLKKYWKCLHKANGGSALLVLTEKWIAKPVVTKNNY
jgi:hypothetical protein